jgi:hypothetical protein
VPALGLHPFAGHADRLRAPAHAASSRRTAAPPTLRGILRIAAIVNNRSQRHADHALREAVRAAVDAGLYERAAKLIDILREDGHGATVIELPRRR